MRHSIYTDNISKQYKLGKASGEDMFRDILLNIFRRPIINGENDKKIWAIKDFSMKVQEGEVLGVIGRNGSGKSTLLKILSKITHPTSGSFKVHGKVASLLEVGTGFHEELTGRENIFLNGSILGMEKKEITSKMDEIIAFAGVENFIDTPIKRYSSGMRLRLGFAVAAHLVADVLFVDEVLAVGDIEFQKKCLSTMGDLRNRGRTLIFVSHNMAAIENICSRGIWIDNGVMRMDGEVHTVINAYMSSFGGTKQTGFDFSNVTSRRGTSEIMYTGMEYLGVDRTPLSLIRSGDELVIRLHYNCHQNIANPNFGIKISTDMGTLVTDLSTYTTGADVLFLNEGKGYIDLILPFVNLMPGRYYLSLWLTAPGYVFYDVLEHCAVLDVEASNYYQSGRGIDSRFGIIFFPCKWCLSGMSMSNDNV